MTADEELKIRHGERFRKVSNRYPRRVAEAFDGDLAQAAAATDEEVAARVQAWEIAQGLVPRDWLAIVRDEGPQAYFRKRSRNLRF